MKFIPSVIFISTDGGSDHKNTNIQNQAAMLGIVLLLDLFFCIGNRNAPDGSWINAVERIMSLLNISLQWCSFERNKITDIEIENLVSKCNSMTELREKCNQDNRFLKGWIDSLKDIKMKIGNRFTALSLKDEKVKFSTSDTNDDVIVLQELVREECPNFFVTKTTKVALKSMPYFVDRVYKNGSKQNTYLSVIKGKGENRTKTWVKKYVEQSIPNPWLLEKNDKHFISLKKHVSYKYWD